MCKAYSCLVKRDGNVIWEMGIDSHSKLVEKFGLEDDKLNPDFARVEITPNNGDYLYPDKWSLNIDEEIEPTWWSKTHVVKAWKAHEKWVAELNKILIKKPIIHPFKDVKMRKRLTKKDKEMLKRWASVRGSVRDSVRASVRGSVGDSVGGSVGGSVWDSVRASVWDSVRGSVGDSVRASVRASVWAYIGSFFSLKRNEWKYTEDIDCGNEYPFYPSVYLWERGMVPSFDGTTWRVHSGPEAKVIYEWKR